MISHCKRKTKTRILPSKGQKKNMALGKKRITAHRKLHDQ